MPETLPVQDRVALVSGASRGIGRAVASALAGAGARVALLARNRADLEAAALACGGLPVVTDVSDPASVSAAVAHVREALGPASILVNNAGRPGSAQVAELTWATWRAVLDVNVGGAFLLSQAVLPDMLAQGGGDIVNIASGAALQGYAGMAAYCASKPGAKSLTPEDVAGAVLAIVSQGPRAWTEEWRLWPFRTA
jgi:NADP-dependent 3-hydroxy acid dehydrogenase YdfG